MYDRHTLYIPKCVYTTYVFSDKNNTQKFTADVEPYSIHHQENNKKFWGKSASHLLSIFWAGNWHKIGPARPFLWKKLQKNNRNCLLSCIVVDSYKSKHQHFGARFVMISFFLFIFSQFFFPPQPTTARTRSAHTTQQLTNFLIQKIASRLDKTKTKIKIGNFKSNAPNLLNLKKYLFKKKCSCATNTTSIVMLVFVLSSTKLKLSS